MYAGIPVLSYAPLYGMLPVIAGYKGQCQEHIIPCTRVEDVGTTTLRCHTAR